MAMVPGNLRNTYGPFGASSGQGMSVYKDPAQSDFDPLEYQQTQPQRDQQNEIARLGVTYAADQRQNRFNQVFPWLQGQIGAMGQGGLATAGGQSGASPEITVGNIWNPNQVQQQVNASRATTDQSTANRMKSVGQDAGMRGFGSNSPLLQALQGQAFASGLGTNVSNEREIRQNAGQQNAEHLATTQGMRETQHATRMKEEIERAKPYWATMNSLIGALSGLV